MGDETLVAVMQRAKQTHYYSEIMDRTAEQRLQSMPVGVGEQFVFSLLDASGAG